jgi:hypothetical protein
MDRRAFYLSCLLQAHPPATGVLGRFSALESEIEELVFARTKFFTEGLPDDHDEHYYMEREWRLPEGLAFRLEDISRIILPRDYSEKFRDDVPDYAGRVLAVEPANPI